MGLPQLPMFVVLIAAAAVRLAQCAGDDRAAARNARGRTLTSDKGAPVAAAPGPFDVTCVS